MTPKNTVILDKAAGRKLLSAIDEYVSAAFAARGLADPPRLCRPNKAAGQRPDEPLFDSVVGLVGQQGVIIVPKLAQLLCMSPTRIRRIVHRLASQGRLHFDRGEISLPKVSISGKRMGRPSKAPHYTKVVTQFLSRHPGELVTTADILAATGIPAGTWPTIRRLMQANGQIVRHVGKNDRDVRFSVPAAETPASVEGP